MNKSGKETPVRIVDGGQHQKFIDLCKSHSVTPTKRQLSKYRNKKGILYKKAHGGA